MDTILSRRRRPAQDGFAGRLRKIAAASPLDEARKMVAAGAFKAATKKFFWSYEGVKAADESVAEIVTKVGQDASSAAAGAKDLRVAYGMEGAGYGVVRMGAASALFNWERAANTCYERALKVRVFDAPFETPQEQKEGKSFIRFGKPPQRWQASFTIDRDPALGVCWTNGGEMLSGGEVAGTVLEQLVKMATAR